jgi:hypothetical protein
MKKRFSQRKHIERKYHAAVHTVREKERSPTMKRKPTIKGSMSYFLLLQVLAFSLVFTVPGISVAQPHRRDVVFPRGPDRGKRIHRLPRGYKTVRIGPKKYYRHRRTYYRQAPGGFMVIGPPIGAVVASLPFGFMRVLIGGAPYYRCDGTYYQRVYGGYRIVEAPSREVVVIEKETRVNDTPPRIGDVVSVTAQLLNVRSGPGIDFGVIHRVRRGDTLEVQGRSNGWLNVLLPSGEYGWIMERYTTRTNSGASG